MKRFSSMLCIFMAMTLVFAPVAEAKRMGGKSMGRTYKTAPAPAKSQPQSNSTAQQNRSADQKTTAGNQQAAQQQKSSRWGMLGGALAGLAAGGLLASLLGGGAFSGMQGLDFMLLGLLAVGAFFLFRRLRRKNAQSSASITPQQPPLADKLMGKNPAVEGYGGAMQKRIHGADEASSVSVSSGIIGGSDVPENLPAGFDQQAFLEGAREHYVTLQKAWNENNLELIREYMSPALFEQLTIERGKLEGKQHTEVLFVDAGIVRADYTSRVAQVSIKYSGRYKDTVEGLEEDISDVWHLERDITSADAPWLIVGME
ncbi:Tim44-like domain-containing protein [Endozoicomonas sp.]|nr:Tim44-like domain-containing protein [Endozoicomonas sp.]